MENLKKVLEVFLDSERMLKTAEVAEISGLEKKEVEKIIKKLVKEEKVHSPKRCYYEKK